MKKCPYCQEEIQDEAIKCRFCGEYLKKKKKWLNCFFGCVIAFIVLILLIVLLTYLGFLTMKFIVYKLFFAGPNLRYSPPFTAGGLEGLLRDFSEAFRLLWERLIDFLHRHPQNYRVTF